MALRGRSFALVAAVVIAVGVLPAQSVATTIGAVAAAPAAAALAPSVPGAFVAVAPQRLLDTRKGVGGSGPVVKSGTVHLQVTGRGGVPATGVSAVVMNVTVTAPSGSGYITAYPDGTSLPTASNLNFVKGQTVPNLVTVKVGTNGKVALRNGSGGTVQLIADVAGYYLDGAPSVPGAFVAVAPQRLLDTRKGVGGSGPVVKSGTVHLQVTGRGGVPATGVSAVVMNVTVTAPSGSGYITAYPDGTSLPTASNLNFVKGQTVPNLVTVKVGTNGKVALRNGSGGTVQLIADVAGYYLDGAPSVPGAFVAVAPQRLLDTRKGVGGSGPVVKSGTVHLQVTGRGGVPATGVSAVVMNVTVTAPSGSGYITAYPDGTSLPTASNLNFVKGQTVPNLVTVKVGTNGKVALRNGSGGTVQLIADVAGYYLDPVVADTTAPGPVTAVTVTATTSSTVALSWTNPADADLQAVMVRRATGATAPTSPTAGTLVADVPKGTTTLTDTALSPATQYSYAFFAHDAVPNYASGVTKSATTTATALMSWSAPANIVPDVGRLVALSCPSASFCVAVNDSGKALTFDGTSWSAPFTIDANEPLTGVSCPSSSFCAAVDGFGDVVTFDGSAWSAPTNVASSLTAVSCSSASFCVAVDAYSGEAVTFDGTSWSDPTAVDPGGWISVSCVSDTFCLAVNYLGTSVTFDGSAWSTPVATDANLSDVSCPSASFCAAVNSDTGDVVTFDGTAWSAPTNIDSTGLLSVSCPSASFCAAVDYDGNAVTFDGSAWSDPTPIDQGRYLRSVSCPSASFCAAVDDTGNVVTFDGSAWSVPANIQTTGSLMSVSCPSASFCAAVDYDGNAVTFDGSAWSAPANIASSLISVSCPATTFCAAVGSVFGQAVTFNGTSWSPPTTIDTIAGLRSVSCPSASFCVAVDNSGNSLTFNGTSWSAPTPIDANGFLEAVSCASASFCIAVDGMGQAVKFNGTSWSAPTTAASIELTAVSCPSASFCIAVDAVGEAVTFNGSSWSAPTTADPLSDPAGLRAVSCASASFCVAADPNGNVVTFDGASWSSPANIAPSGGLGSVSCPSASFCAAVDSLGNALIGRTN